MNIENFDKLIQSSKPILVDFYAKRFHIQSVPTLIIFKDGNQRWRQSGIISAHALTTVLKNYI